jgi:four helix bundle protein
LQNEATEELMGDFKNLLAWRKADDLVVAIYKAFQARDGSSLTGLRGQLMRSAESIADNLAEGCAKRSDAEFKKYCDQAYSSSKEAENQLIRAHRIGALSPAAYAELAALSDEVSRLCWTLSGRKKRGQ